MAQFNLPLYLDTHIIIWLYLGDKTLLSKKAIQLVNTHALYISPIVKLELQYLFEINKLKISPNTIIDYLMKKISVTMCTESFITVIESAKKLHWTRDPFDRIIVAQAASGHHLLLTKDQTILSNYSKAIWE